jgi:hypothetical protein
MAVVALILKVLFWSLFATVVACIEIESEGRFGWADKAPTWYRTTGFWAKAYGLVMGGKPLTGYHAFMFFLPVLIFHSHFFLGVQWSVVAELGTWALYFGWCPLWDYFWFVLNPAYAGKFDPEHVWWHAKSPWVFGLFPLDYLIGVLLSLGFAGGAAWLSGSLTSFADHLKLLGGFGVYTTLLRIAAPRYHRWYARMRERDDRDKVDIF